MKKIIFTLSITLLVLLSVSCSSKTTTCQSETTTTCDTITVKTDKVRMPLVINGLRLLGLPKDVVIKPDYSDQVVYVDYVNAKGATKKLPGFILNDSTSVAFSKTRLCNTYKKFGPGSDLSEAKQKQIVDQLFCGFQRIQVEGEIAKTSNCVTDTECVPVTTNTSWFDGLVFPTLPGWLWWLLLLALLAFLLYRCLSKGSSNKTDKTSETISQTKEKCHCNDPCTECCDDCTQLQIVANTLLTGAQNNNYAKGSIPSKK